MKYMNTFPRSVMVYFRVNVSINIYRVKILLRRAVIWMIKWKNPKNQFKNATSLIHQNRWVQDLFCHFLHMYVYINRNNLYNSYKHFTFLIIYQAGDTSFEFIDENIFYSEFPREDTIECVCEEIRGNDCLNRRSFDECSIDSCKLGMLCDNNQIRKKKCWLQLKLF